ncbi:MAG: glycosyltransferase family 39 protein, partial [Clostridiales bacterium]|nr:glycosyltransferase family 39 protein [Clostridiales bacterium]
HWDLTILVLLTAAGYLLRLLCCFWGRPLQLYADEWTIVDNAIDMLSRHSWEARVYNRPDQFEIKCCAVLFTLISHLRYHLPAWQAFTSHQMAFYMIARGYTTLFGTAMIPLTAIFAGRMADIINVNRRATEGTAAALTAFSALFVQQSAYATPDVTLTFFVVLFGWFYFRYLENGEKRDVRLAACVIGIGISIKYPAAMLAAPLALMVIWREGVLGKNWKAVITCAFESLLIIVTVLFVIAPNLFTDFHNAWNVIRTEARPHHLGADNLGFWGNLLYYFRIAADRFGRLLILPFMIGLYALIRKRDIRSTAFLIGALYWVCISVLKLHWERWGIPMDAYYLMTASVGVGYGFVLAKKIRPVKMLAVSVEFLLIMNAALSGAAITIASLLPDTRVITLDWCRSNGIQETYCISENYTGYSPNRGFALPSVFETVEGRLQPKEPYRDRPYIILTDSYRSRYLSEPDRYPNEVKVYQWIGDQCSLEYEKTADGNYQTDPSTVKNIFATIKYLAGRKTCAGPTVRVYLRNPEELRHASA